MRIEPDRSKSVIGYRCRQSPQRRHDQRHGQIGRVAEHEFAAARHLPDAVERSLDRVEDAEHGPQQRHGTESGQHARVEVVGGVAGEIDYHIQLGAGVGKELVEAQYHGAQAAQGSHYDERQSQNRYHGEGRIERQRSALHDRAVGIHAAKRIEQQLVGTDQSTRRGTRQLAALQAEHGVCEESPYATVEFFHNLSDSCSRRMTHVSPPIVVKARRTSPPSRRPAARRIASTDRRQSRLSTSTPAPRYSRLNSRGR